MLEKVKLRMFDLKGAPISVPHRDFVCANLTAPDKKEVWMSIRILIPKNRLARNFTSDQGCAVAAAGKSVISVPVLLHHY